MSRHPSHTVAALSASSMLFMSGSLAGLWRPSSVIGASTMPTGAAPPSLMAEAAAFALGCAACGSGKGARAGDGGMAGIVATRIDSARSAKHTARFGGRWKRWCALVSLAQDSDKC
jgi:hypothetical protein